MTDTFRSVGSSLARCVPLVAALLAACNSAATPPGATAPSGQSGASAAAAGLPCAVSEILSANCHSCHAAMPQNGAPMPLVSFGDLTAAARTDASRKVYQLVASRVADRARPMPPDPTKRLSEAAIATLQNWAAGGALPGAACAVAGTAGSAAVGGRGQAGSSARAGSGAAGSGAAPAAGSGNAVAGTAATAGTQSSAAGRNGGGAGSGDPGDVDIETCYELRAHGQGMPGDKTRYTVPTGETYTSFIFKAPWQKPVQGLRFRHLPDNATVLHHWLLYSETGSANDGMIEACSLSGPTGFLCGQASTRALVTGWAPGRGDFRLPAGVGLELPGPGTLLAVEFHYFNSTGSEAQDQSGVEICVTSKFRPNTASVTWLGTQQIDIAAGAQGTASGTCTPLRKGMNASDPIHVLFSWPHMHKLGTHLKSLVTRAAGGQDALYDGDFSFQFQVLHETPILLQPGDKVTTTCSFENMTPASVSFGQSTSQEMCYNFTYAWPAHALDNPGAELGGASNTCLH